MRIHNTGRTAGKPGRRPAVDDLPESDLLTVHEVACILRVDDTTVRRWIKAGVMEAVALPHVNKRCAYRVRRETLDGLLGQQVRTA